MLQLEESVLSTSTITALGAFITSGPLVALVLVSVIFGCAGKKKKEDHGPPHPPAGGSSAYTTPPPQTQFGSAPTTSAGSMNQSQPTTEAWNGTQPGYAQNISQSSSPPSAVISEQWPYNSSQNFSQQNQMQSGIGAKRLSRRKKRKPELVEKEQESDPIMEETEFANASEVDEHDGAPESKPKKPRRAKRVYFDPKSKSEGVKKQPEKKEPKQKNILKKFLQAQLEFSQKMTDTIEKILEQLEEAE